MPNPTEDEIVADAKDQKQDEAGSDGQEPKTEAKDEPQSEILGWDLERQRDDQKQANIDKLKGELGDAKAQLADLTTLVEEQKQRDAEAEKAADLKVTEFTDEEALTKALSAVQGQLAKVQTSATEAQRVATETAASYRADQDARTVETQKVQRKAGLEALKTTIASLGEQYGSHLTKEAIEAANAFLEGHGYDDDKPPSLESAQNALQIAFMDERLKEEAGLREKPKVGVDDGTGGKTGAPLKEGTLEEVMADMQEEGKFA